jgi:hypothetical protein
MTHNEEMKTALLKTRGEDISALALLMAEFANSCCYRSDGFEEAANAFSEAAILRAVEAEREACAKVCDGTARAIEEARAHAEGCLSGVNQQYFMLLLSTIGEITGKIRSRSNADVTGLAPRKDEQ